jgi:hypothetical protein
MLHGYALQELHRDELTILMTADFIDGADVGVVQGGGGAGFPAEPLQGLRVLGNIVRKEFQSDEAAKIVVFGFVDHTHPAAELFDDAVVRDGLADHWAEILGPGLGQVNEGAKGSPTWDH